MPYARGTYIESNFRKSRVLLADIRYGPTVIVREHDVLCAGGCDEPEGDEEIDLQRVHVDKIERGEELAELF